MTAVMAPTLPAQLRPAEGAPPVPQATRYRLATGLQVIPGPLGGLLFSARPLVALRLNRVGLSLIAGLSSTCAGTAAELAADVPDLSPVEATAFLDGLAGRRLVVREPPEPAVWPSVTVIVAAHGRPAATRACVQSLLALDYPADLVQILIVDDASNPALAPLLEDLPVRVIRLDRNVGQSAARNLAAAEATGDLLAFTDNDCTADPRWLRDLVPWFDTPERAAVGGRVLAPPADGPVARFEAVRSPLDMGAAGGEVGPRESVAYLPTCNLIVRRDALLAAAGFDGDMRVGEDVDFLWRLLQAGGRACYVPAGPILHDHRVELGALLARRADYGSSEADLQTRHPDSGRIQHVPRAGLAGLAALTIAPVSWPAAIGLMALALALLGTELAGKRRKLRGLGLAVPLWILATALLREHGAGLYHLGRDVTRYYAVPLAALAVAWPPVLPATAILMLAPPVADHRRLRPGLSLPVFVGLTWVEMAAYQLGVWRGCLARQCWRPLLPSISWRP